MNKKFQVVSHEYVNTGGNCMVSVFAVYNKADKVMRYVLANEEGFILSSFDYISNEMPDDFIYEDVMIEIHDWTELTTDPCWDQHLFTDDEFELYKYCEFEYYKKDCKYFNNKVRIAVNNLPNDLFNKLTKEYIAWAELEGVGCLTDGFDVFMDEGYAPPVVEADDLDPYANLARQLQEIKNFRRWFNDLIGPNATEDKLQELYESYITISVAGNSVKLPFDAENFNNIDTVLKRCIEEW